MIINYDVKTPQKSNNDFHRAWKEFTKNFLESKHRNAVIECKDINEAQKIRKEIHWNLRSMKIDDCIKVRTFDKTNVEIWRE